MSLINCRECNHEVSTEAKTCPSCGVEYPAPKAKRKSNVLGLTIFWVLSFGLIIWVLTPDTPQEPQKEISLAERYPGKWRTNFHKGIATALARNKIRGCGEFKYKPSSQDRGEYVVYCTRNGKDWISYLVWIPSNEISGPHTASPELE